MPPMVHRSTEASNHPVSGPPLQVSKLRSGRRSHWEICTARKSQSEDSPLTPVTTPLGASLASGVFSGTKLLGPGPRPVAYSLEAVPGPSGAPHILAQRVQEVTQLLGAHGHLLPDQLQVLRATGPMSHPLTQDPTRPWGAQPRTQQPPQDRTPWSE